MSDQSEREERSEKTLAFGNAIRDVRNAKGIYQKEVAARVSRHYSEEAAYRRIERGVRKASRDAARAIVVDGLKITDVNEINRLIGLLGYSPLSQAEVLELQLERPQEPVVASAVVIEPIAALESHPTVLHPRAVKGTVASALVLTFVVAAFLPSGNGFAVAGSALYAALFPLSLLLETAYDTTGYHIYSAAALTFALIEVSSIAGIAGDAVLVNSGRPSLLVSVSVFCLAAIGQWFMVRRVLSDQAVVAASYQTHTGQAAHLKNTLYFVFAAIFFLIAPFQCVLLLRRQVQLGHLAQVRSLISRPVIVGGGIVCFGPLVLSILLVALLGISLLMRGKLIDNLKQNSNRNRFTILFYLRAVVYFGLCLLCVVWFASAIADLSPE